jgi:hypothetical protein
MNSDFNTDYYTIIRALKSEHNLLAVTSDDHFKEVSWLGRTWRLLTGTSFTDCYAPIVGNKIVAFVQQNKDKLSPTHKDDLIEGLKTLEKRIHKNKWNIKLNIETIENIQTTGKSSPKASNPLQK